MAIFDEAYLPPTFRFYGQGAPTVATVSVDAYFLGVPNSASKSANSGRC
jgi:hypothetical protein